VANQTFIDATTQPGYAGTPLIVIDGSGVASNGLRLQNNTVVRGVSIVGCVSHGIVILGDGNTVRSNHVGVTPSGTLDGNGGAGVYCGGSGNTVGGTTTAEGNRIAGNSGSGVVVAGLVETGNTIRLNSIYDNNGLAIDLGDDGETPNDALDGDSGPNMWQNFPVITSVDVINGQIQGTLNSTANQSFWVDIYSSPECYESATFLGSAVVLTDVSGNGSFSVPFSGTVLRVTATATGTTTGNTSELSACAASPFTVTNTLDSGVGSLRQAILNANTYAVPKEIVFAIGSGGWRIIRPMSTLPALTQPTVINGYTQPGSSPNTNGPGLGSNAVLTIELDGSLLGGGQGIAITADSCTIRGLVINRFPVSGVYMNGNNNRVEGCYIGTNRFGSAALPNGNGVVWNGSNNTIGGATPDARNVISGNSGYGLRLLGGSGNTIVGNVIGLREDGQSGLGNGGDGVSLATTTLTVVGGSSSAHRNIISANAGNGVHMASTTGSFDNQVLGNYIGTDITGVLPRGNAGDGVYVSISSGTGIAFFIGGPAVGNVIAYNGGSGVDVSLASTLDASILNNTIRANGDSGVIIRTGYNIVIGQNTFLSNTGLAIDLGADGVTPNDLGDADLGANALQNYPVLNSATSNGSSVSVAGTMGGPINTAYRIEFFSSDSCDPSGYGEGATYLGFQNVTTTIFGIANINAVFSVALPGGHVVTATARRLSTNDTSEMSACRSVINTVAGGDVVVVPVDEGTGTTPITMTFDSVTTAGATTLNISDMGPPPPGGFTFGDSVTYYDVSTTASYSGDIEVCITYDEADVPAPESALMLLHFDTTQVPPHWVDVTSSLDVGANVICGTTQGLSPFVIAKATTPTGIGATPGVPRELALLPNYPNPFNPSTTIAYDVPASGADVTIRIYDVAGRLVRTLVNGRVEPGRGTVVWEGRGDRGEWVSSGVYFVRMESRAFSQTRKIVMLK
jgi:hypothetical protein